MVNEKADSGNIYRTQLQDIVWPVGTTVYVTSQGVISGSYISTHGLLTASSSTGGHYNSPTRVILLGYKKVKDSKKKKETTAFKSGKKYKAQWKNKRNRKY